MTRVIAEIDMDDISDSDLIDELMSRRLSGYILSRISSSEIQIAFNKAELDEFSSDLKEAVEDIIMFNRIGDSVGFKNGIEWVLETILNHNRTSNRRNLENGGKISVRLR